MADPLLIGDYRTANPADSEHVDPKLYEECGDYDEVSKKFNALMLDYNDTDGFQEMNLVLF
jgi:dynein heavy chain